MRFSLVPALSCSALHFSAVLSFSVTVGSSPTQCGSLNVAWTGGVAPFEIMLTPAFDVPRNISIPSSAFTNNHGSFQISPVPFFNETKFLLTMSDATGFATGGTSDLLTVGLPIGNVSCNTTSPTLPFTFGLPSALQQCSSYVFDEYNGASLPVTVTGLIPGGDSFLLQSPSTGTSFSWIADVAAGTTIIFAMTDAQGRPGGSSDTQTVANSNIASCLSATSPSSTIDTSSSSASATSSSTSSHTQTSSSSGVSTGTIIGAAVGAVIAVTAVAVLAVCYLKRQRFGRPHYGLAPTRNLRQSNSVELDPGTDNFQYPPIYPFPYQTDSANRPARPTIPNSPATPASYQVTSPTVSLHTSELPYAYQSHSRTNSNTDSFVAFGDVASSSMSSSGRRKAGMAGMSSHPAARFILHTDAEDCVPEVEDEVVELPPQYSERRMHVATGEAGERPISSLTGVSSAYSRRRVDEPTQFILRPPPE